MRRVASGESVSSVSSDIGFSTQAVYNWCRAAAPEVSEGSHERRGVSPVVELSVVLTDRGETLVMRDVTRCGAQASSVRHVAGAPLGTGERVRGRVLSRFEVPLPRLIYLASEARKNYEGAGFAVAPSATGR